MKQGSILEPFKSYIITTFMKTTFLMSASVYTYLRVS